MRKLLLQLDADRLPGAFDRIVAHDAGADEVLSYCSLAEEDVRGLIHGAIFTRGPKDLIGWAEILLAAGPAVEVADLVLDAEQIYDLAAAL
jgi:hypothetical protein